MRVKKNTTFAGRFISAVITMVCAFCMICAAALPVDASDVADSMTPTDDPRESILMITLGYEDDNGFYLDYQAGTCFMINDEYVLTNKHVVSLSTTEDIDESGEIDFDEFVDWARENFTNVPENMLATDQHIKIKVYVNRDMTIDGTMHNSVNSDDMDFAAVKLAEKIYDRKPVALGDSSTLEAKATVYAMGFPEDSIRTIEYNTKNDVSTTSGTVSKVAVITDQRGVSARNVDAIEHSATLNFGNSGGPLLDENDIVVGVNSYVSSTRNYSIQINVIKTALDTFGIPYIDGSGIVPDPDPEPEPEPEPDNTAILAELQSVLDKARAIETDGYTEETVAVLDDCIGAAESVLTKGDEAAESEILVATDDLNNAIDGLEEQSGPNMVLIIGIVAAVVIIIIIIVVVVVSSGKKKKAAQTKTTAAPGYPNGPMAGMSPEHVQGPAGGSAVGPMAGAGMAPEGAGETTLLDAGAGETTLLGGGAAAGAYLIRKKNGEKIMINLQNFKIGKERRRVNYCVADNTTVSRLHCEIVKKGADYYVIDQGSANYTYVNGVQLSPNKETLLSDQSVLKLSDEEFEFHLS